MEVLNKELIINIVDEKDYQDICESGPYPNDGLIISPLNGSRELKIKPKSLHTLDLLFNGKNWIDREKNVWRCYPIILSLLKRCFHHKINWLDTLDISIDGNNFFYHPKKSSISKKWRCYQNQHLENILEKINPTIKTSWLDLQQN